LRSALGYSDWHSPPAWGARDGQFLVDWHWEGNLTTLAGLPSWLLGRVVLGVAGNRASGVVQVFDGGYWRRDSDNKTAVDETCCPLVLAVWKKAG
jgi:hypothetical protein